MMAWGVGVEAMPALYDRPRTFSGGRFPRRERPNSVGAARDNRLMASTNAAQTALVIPSDGPHAKFVRYARAVANEHPPLFPITPATRPLVVGLDLRTLGPQPADYEDLVPVLRRAVVTPKLMVFDDDGPDLVTAWIEVCEVEERFVVHYTDPQSAGRVMDAMEFSVSTMHGEERRGWRKCHFFDVYALLDAQNTPTTDLNMDDRIRAAVMASAGYGLGTDVIVSLGPTVGRADVGDNDIVATEQCCGAAVQSSSLITRARFGRTALFSSITFSRPALAAFLRASTAVTVTRSAGSQSKMSQRAAMSFKETRSGR
jgi:hypothetical protein